MEKLERLPLGVFGGRMHWVWWPVVYDGPLPLPTDINYKIARSVVIYYGE